MSFNFNSNNELCIGNTPLSDFTNKYFADHNEITNDNDQQLQLNQNNELIEFKTRLQTPVFLYSKNKILDNFYMYKNSFNDLLSSNPNHGIQTHISYALKANYNPSILKIFQENGSWCSLVNKHELNLALRCGFKGENLIFNGNGKTFAEIELAVKSNCYLNIDSLFNLKHTIKVCQKLGNSNFLPAKIVIRINQLINAQVHQYLSTSVESCKFGIVENDLESLIEIINENKNLVKLVGFHTHLGSTIKNLSLYDESVKHLISIMNLVREKYNIDSIDFLNFGGGLGIDYEKYAFRTKQVKEQANNYKMSVMPYDLALVISKYAVELKNLKIIVEPGRSLVGNTGILISHLIGTKLHENRKFLVVDASMCECIRPCLYSAYHHIEYIKPISNSSQYELVDVVGPVCESGDFLGKDLYMQIPSQDSAENDEPIYLAIMVKV